MVIKKGKIEFNVIGNEPFWNGVNSNSWEAATFEIFEKYLDKDHGYLDIGAWIGPTALFGAQLAKHCYAFEPDHFAYALLTRNIALNPDIKNLIALRYAIGAVKGKSQLGVKDSRGDSMSSFIWSKDPLPVDTLSLADVFSEYGITDCNFIKMDIEGGEAIVLPAAKSYLQSLPTSPTLYLSLHIPWFKDKAEYMAKICDTLALYHDIFDTDGKRLSLDDVSKLEGFPSIVATNVGIVPVKI